METSLFLGKLLGIFFLLGGVGMALNPKHYEKTFLKLMKDEAVMFTLGVLLVTGGTAMVLTHNIWTASWVVVITIIGWAMLIKGLAILVTPRVLPAIYDIPAKYKKLPVMGGVVWIILGGLLAYCSFYA